MACTCKASTITNARVPHTTPTNHVRQILFLAVPGVILGASLTAVFVKLILRFDWSWSLSMVFGSMVAATDPVAVVALLEELVREKEGFCLGIIALRRTRITLLGRRHARD